MRRLAPLVGKAGSSRRRSCFLAVRPLPGGRRLLRVVLPHRVRERPRTAPYRPGRFRRSPVLPRSATTLGNPGRPSPPTRCRCRRRRRWSGGALSSMLRALSFERLGSAGTLSASPVSLEIRPGQTFEIEPVTEASTGVRDMQAPTTDDPDVVARVSVYRTRRGRPVQGRGRRRGDAEDLVDLLQLRSSRLDRYDPPQHASPSCVPGRQRPRILMITCTCFSAVPET